MKFVTGAGEPSEPHAFKAVVHLEVSKTHLDTLAFIPRFEEALRSHLPPRHIAGIFVTGMTSNAARQDIRLGGIVLLRDSHFETA